MYFKCCVRNCSSTRKDAMLHKFPCNENRLLKWIQCLNDDKLNRSSIHNLFVCQKHFERRFVRENSRLLYDAYPTLFTPAEITTGVPECKENVDPKVDHSYSRKRHIDHTYAKDLPPTSSSDVLNFRKVLKPLVSNTISKNKVELSVPDSSVPGSSEQSCSVIPLDASHIMDSGIKEPLRNILRVEVRSQTPTTDACKANNENIIYKTTPKKSGRKRIIHTFNKLTPTCKLIYKEYTKAKNQADYHRRAKRAVKFAKENSFEKMAEKMNPYAKKIIEMQINLCTKKKKGRRFTLEEKLITLAIMKQSPKCYRFLHKIFILPSSSTLNKMVSRLKIEAGINPQFFTLMKKEVDSWEDSKKYCSILFDEMALGMGLSYNSKDDKIHGFVELTERKNKFADHVLVFMARGAVHKWQQPIAYYFCEGATSGPELKKIIKDIVSAIADIDLKPIVLGCDQGTAFQSAVRYLQEDTRREQLLRNEEPDQSVIIGYSKLSVIYDPSHLIKGIRNNFLSKDIKWKGKISKWQDIVDVYKTDCSHTQSRILHKLNDEHVIPAKVKKMKVKNCVRVLSKSVAAALSYTSQFSTYVDGTPVSETLKNTAETVSFFDDLFDSVNGAAATAKAAKGKTLRTAVKDSSQHHKFWVEAIKHLEQIKFMENGREKSVPTLKNFVTTLKSYMRLWQVFKSNDLRIMRPRYFNTDPVENYFGQVRAYNYRNTDPTCHNFINTYKALTITRVIKFHSDGFNCEDDPAEQLINLQCLFQTDENKGLNQEIQNKVLLGCSEPDSQGILEQARKERLSTHSKAYVTGWVIRKTLEKNPCSLCKKSLTSNKNETIHNWISHKEFKASHNSRKLSYPSGVAVRCFGTVLNKTNEFLEKNAHTKDILKTIINEMDAIDLVNCPEHKDFVHHYFLHIVIRFTIYNWCNTINKILKGVDIVRLEGKNLPYYQKLAYEKYLKRIKNKTLNK